MSNNTIHDYSPQFHSEIGIGTLSFQQEKTVRYTKYQVAAFSKTSWENKPPKLVRMCITIICITGLHFHGYVTILSLSYGIDNQMIMVLDITLPHCSV